MFFITALTSLVLGALYVNALSVPVAREPALEPKVQDVETSDHLRSREAEPGIQELEARILPLLAAIGPPAAFVGGGAALIAHGNRSKSKRDILDDVLSREVQNWAQLAGSVRAQASKR